MKAASSLFISALLGLAAVVNAAPEVHTYRVAEGRALRLWLEKPADWKAGDRRPAVLFFHGGGWTSGAPDQFAEHCRHLAQRGMVAASAEYRFWDRGGAELAPTRCVEDARSALRWLLQHADELGLDRGKIGVGGGSAGGHLAALTAFDLEIVEPGETPKPAALILFNPALDLTVKPVSDAARMEALRKLSPRLRDAKSLPPTLIMVGEKDTTTPAAIAQNFAENARKQGAKVEVLLYAGQAHGFFNYKSGGNPWYDKTLADMDHFLEQLGWLAPQKTVTH